MPAIFFAGSFRRRRKLKVHLSEASAQDVRRREKVQSADVCTVRNVPMQALAASEDSKKLQSVSCNGFAGKVAVRLMHRTRKSELQSAAILATSRQYQK